MRFEIENEDSALDYEELWRREEEYKNELNKIKRERDELWRRKEEYKNELNEIKRERDELKNERDIVRDILRKELMELRSQPSQKGDTDANGRRKSKNGIKNRRCYRCRNVGHLAQDCQQN